MRLPSIERKFQLQAQYRDAVHRLAVADEGDDERRKRMARWKVDEAVQALRSIGINPIRAR
ncbi:hypothetical protein [Streptomyces gibsoniae]|uniref:Uncharacterized protein n=1 Tax=Streptomyces gibsoniae TaxID=3075529 RepID=A0ABU2U6G1_9ACTN|nr:hypothetical protein [Streptomyces sp. DSM 41699]MDT0468814.1 hypothetical protein [Streptomyces sp. DSM 41699]